MFYKKNWWFYTPKNHPFQIIDKSAIPFFLSLCVLNLVLSILLYIHNLNCEFLISSIKLNLILFIFTVYIWFLFMQDESTQAFVYTKQVQNNILTGMQLFIASEIFLFVSFFWAFFHSSLNPSIFIGAVWPPVGIQALSAWKIPFLNTIILLVSGVTVNCYYYFLKHVSFYPKNFFYIAKKKFFIFNYKNILIKTINFWEILLTYLFITICLGLFFITVQGYEYIHSSFSISDGIFGSVFYSLTGLHGFHVMLGLVLLTDCFVRTILGDFFYNPKIHVSSTCAVWYWHFVDVVWLFLFIFVYIWGS